MRSLRRSRQLRWGERCAAAAVWGMALALLAFFVCLLGDVVRHGLPGLSWEFFTAPPRHAGREGGIAPILVSTGLILAVCMAAALPFGLGTAVLLAEMTHRRSRAGALVRRSLDVLAGVPSIVFGLFGNAFFCVTLGLGFSIAAGGLTLACMVLPMLIRAAEEGLRAVPHDYRLAAAALGCSQAATIIRLLIPAAMPALLAGFILGLGRAVAETAALIFTSGYVDRMPASLRDSGRALSIHIYDLSMNVPGGDARAYASALVLVALLLVANIGSTWAGRRLVSHTAKPRQAPGRFPRESAWHVTTPSAAAPPASVAPSTTPAASAPAMSMHRVSVFYGPRQALKDVSLSIAPAGVTALVGPSGSGKTSVLACVNRLTDVIPSCRVTGAIHWAGLDVLAPDTDVLRLRRRIGMLFQKPNPFPFSIRQNLAGPLREHGVTDVHLIDERLESALRRVGLWQEVCDRLDTAALALSGGQQQRLCLARALALSPEALLMDEPCSALDPMAGGRIEDLIMELRGQYTIVIVTHNLAQARRLADHAALFWVRHGAGCLIEQGPAAQVFDHPRHPLTMAYVNGARPGEGGRPS